jgi:hypothetical protein
MAKVAGTCFIRVNGDTLSLRGNLTVSLGGVECESVVGIDQYHGLMEKPRASYIEADITFTEELDMKNLEGLRDVTVQVDLINGWTGVLYQANQVKAFEYTAEDGKFTVRFEGPSGEWLQQGASQ